MKNDIREILGKRRIILDGGTGTLLAAKGLRPDQSPEDWNTERPEEIYAAARGYLDAGSDVICTNTFGCGPLRHDDYEKLVKAAVETARKAADDAEKEDGRKRYVALDIGPTGKLMRPSGELSFDGAYDAFSGLVRAGAPYCDLVLVETFTDLREMKAAVLAAKENSGLPVFACCVFGADGMMSCGADAAAAVIMLESLGADAVGVNCSSGPDKLKGVVRDMCRYASVPVIVKPNAGMPEIRDGKTVYNIDPPEFAGYMRSFAEQGASVLGGCCGTTPEYIRAMLREISAVTYEKPYPKTFTAVSSFAKTVFIGGGAPPCVIGERINPTGKPKLKEALKNNDISYILKTAVSEEEDGADVLDVNCGMPGIDEKRMMRDAVEALQSVTGLPLQIDSSDPQALEQGLRYYVGKPLINSVNGKKESMESVLPLAARYGGVLIALTLDENGIPDTAEGRFAIAEKILVEAGRYGIPKKNIIFDPLALTISTGSGSAAAALESIRLIKERLGCGTSLGISNISFGLPGRDMLNSAFLVSALCAGLDAAIVNPGSVQIKSALRSWCALAGLDAGFGKYIAFADSVNAGDAHPAVSDMTLGRAVVRGLAEDARACAEKKMNAGSAPLSVIDEVIAALNEVGAGFEKGKIYLPQLLMSAEAAKAVCSYVNTKFGKTETHGPVPVILATVKGDIHDIGKNIVKVLLENYGFRVLDLGRDVPPWTVLEAAEETGAYIVGLSALMTTTLPSMEETVRLINDRLPDVKTVVGGAVLTQDYADSINASFYAKDALQMVRFAEKTYSAHNS